MKKREFQKKAAAALLGKLADVVMELEENPNITITSEYHSSYFKLTKNYNRICWETQAEVRFMYNIMLEMIRNI